MRRASGTLHLLLVYSRRRPGVGAIRKGLYLHHFGECNHQSCDMPLMRLRQRSCALTTPAPTGPHVAPHGLATRRKSLQPKVLWPERALDHKAGEAWVKMTQLAKSNLKKT
jgi:hypothetical protein